MDRIDTLAERYKRYISLPWQKDLAGAQRAIFIVYDKADERRLRARKALFEMATKDGGHEWIECDLTGAFAEWMASTEYRESYFESPQDLELKLEEDFLEHVAGPGTGDADGAESRRGVGRGSIRRRLPVRVRPRFGIDGGDRTGRKGPASWCSFPGSTRTATIGCWTRGMGGTISRFRSPCAKIEGYTA